MIEVFEIVDECPLCGDDSFHHESDTEYRVKCDTCRFVGKWPTYDGFLEYLDAHETQRKNAISKRERRTATRSKIDEYS